MLADRRCHTTLPVPDIDRARGFYEGVLGFAPFQVLPGAVFYRAGEGTLFAISKASGKASGAATQMAFSVPDVEAEVLELQSRGVVFEEYDLPGLKTVNGVARLGAGLAAWFFDPDHNLIAVLQLD